ncbi:glucokinase [Roseomonas sp. E05]|uniref:glucokinase n=1 Tax=Roseomonas sp. E05 TaxID=3046310 RepID=UPI0024B94E9D|nr:glucokinase [Roseomonas sp. E05]MDJ0389208.1 glucokinase [Roseomonas sp. E05]
MTRRLLADLGGTNARFALSEAGGPPQEERKLAVADHPGVVEAARAYLAGRTVEEAVFAVATPVRGDTVTFTNNTWHFSIRAAQQALDLERLTVINDFVAQAAAISLMTPEDLRVLKPGQPQAERPQVVLGPGTGLGVAFVLREGGAAHILPSEGGHASFAPQDALQAEILQRLRPLHGGHVSTERLLSGPGLLQLTRILGEIRGAAVPVESPADVSQRAASGACPICAEAVRLFSAILGATAGNLALTLLTGGGVYITGGLCRGLGPLLDQEALLTAFHAKGRFAGLLEAVPVVQVLRPHTGLLGAAAYRPRLMTG